MQEQEFISIQAYGLESYLKEIQEGFTKGYVLDFESNQHFPQMIGHVLTCGMVKPTVAQKATNEAKKATGEAAPKVKSRIQDGTALDGRRKVKQENTTETEG